jgi:hypothetical protein
LLRGIDLPSIFLSLGIGFLASAAAIQLGIFIACIPTSRPLKGLLSLVALGFTVQLFVTVLAASFMWLRFGVGGPVSAGTLWTTSLLILAIVLGAIGLLFVVSVAILSPASANRALPVRLYMTIAWLMAGGAAAAVSWVQANNVPIGIWMGVSVVLFCVGLFVAASEREALGPRVARLIPRWRWLRPLAFLFYSGAAGGLAWSCLMIVLTILAAALWNSFHPPSYRYDNLSDVIRTTAGLALYAYCYAMTALVVRRTFFPKAKTAYTWMIAICILAIAFMFPIVGHLTRPYEVRYEGSSDLWYLGTPVLISDYARQSLAFTFAGSWALVVALLGLPWFARQVSQFRPYEGNAARQPQVIPEG